MKFGQFCGFLADEIDLQHSDFVLATELLFSIGDGTGELAVALPTRSVTANDAAMILFLIIAMDMASSDPAEAAEVAQELACTGNNLSLLLTAIDEGTDAVVLLNSRFSTAVTVPGHLLAKIRPVTRGIGVSHLRSV